MKDKNNPLERPFENEIRKLFFGQQLSMVIVDDDPTGTQTAHDVPVLGYWTEEAFINEFKLKTPQCFVLANTRTLLIPAFFEVGQIIPGVPVWEFGEETRFPGMPYVVYPGNVGDADSLAKVYDLFTFKHPRH